MNENSQIRLMTAAVGLGGLSVLFFLLVHILCMVQTASVKKLDDRIEALSVREKAHQTLTRSHARWMNFEDSYRRIKERHFFSYAAFSSFREEFSRLIGDSFSRVLRENYQIENIRNEFAKITLDLIFEGEYGKIKGFLWELRKKKKMILIQSLVLKKRGDDCYGEVRMEVYFVR